jgi:hypothetical protein
MEEKMNRSFLLAAAVIAVSAGLAVSGITAASARGKGGPAGGFARGFPHGFSQGEKIGWRGNTVPPGWSHGRKMGWRGAGVPPGARF